MSAVAKEDSQLAVIAQENGLEAPQAEGLLSRFGTTFKKAQTALEKAKGIQVTSEDQVAEMDKARRIRLDLKSIRVEAEHTRKELKEQSLREGKAVDGMANIIKAMIVPVEESLEKAEKFAENLAAERFARLSAERLSVLLKLTDVPTMYSYEKMDQETFDKLVADLTQAKADKEAAELKIQEEAKAAAAAREAEDKRIREENAKLKAEAEVREKELAAERKAAADKAQADKLEAEKKLAEERAARQAVERAQVERNIEEARVAAAAEEEKSRALRAPDRDKLIAFADSITGLEIVGLSSPEAMKLYTETQDYLERIAKNLRNKAKEL